MECVICHVDFTEKALFRTNDTEYYKPEWMCLNCMKEAEPEIYSATLDGYEEKMSRLHEY